MRISTATIDCWRQATDGSSYTDFQHHHWEIGPSGTINAMINNKPTYKWTLNAFGHHGTGTWSATSPSLSSEAQVWINSNSSPPMVNLIQTVNSNVLPSTGNTISTSHDVHEPIWRPITWNPGSSALSSVSFLDMGVPTYQLTFGIPIAVPTGKTEVVAVLTQPMTWNVFPGMGGTSIDNATAKGLFYQLPGSIAGVEWWAWTINLVS
jgi:hypothetical protein